MNKRDSVIDIWVTAAAIGYDKQQTAREVRKGWVPNVYRQLHVLAALQRIRIRVEAGVEWAAAIDLDTCDRLNGALKRGLAKGLKRAASYV